jgi:hypothetical protein
MTVDEVKGLIKKVFNFTLIKEYENYLKYNIIDDINKTIFIKNIEKIPYEENDNFDLFIDNKYEVLISYKSITEEYIYNEWIESNSIKYKIGDLSIEYFLFFLTKLKDDFITIFRRFYGGKLQLLYIKERSFLEKESISKIAEKIGLLTKLSSLKIIHTSNDINILKNQSISYLYSFSKNYTSIIKIFSSYDELIYYLFSTFPLKNKDDNLFIENKKFNSELVYIYQSGTSSTLLRYKYISFYQIIEYFFTESMDKFVFDEVKKNLPIDNINIDEKIKFIIDNVKNNYKYMYDHFETNELNSL